MNRAHTGQTALERLKQIGGRYRAAVSAAEFFVRLVRLNAPVAVGVVTLVFLSKLLWPWLAYAAYVAPAWLLGTALYLCLTRSQWSMRRWRAAAATDLESGNRGVYMALQEADGDDWSADVVETDVRLKGRLPAASAATAAVLLVVLVVVAMLPDLRPPVRRRGAATPVQKMVELVRILDTENLADQEYVDKTKDLIKELKEKEEQTGRMDSEDWQALDQCKEELKRQMLDSFRRFEGAQELSRQLSEKAGQKTPMNQGECEQLADMLENKGAEGLAKLLKERLGRDGLSDEQREALTNAAKQMSPEMLEKLAEKLRNGESPGKGFSDAETKCLAAALEALGIELQEAGEKCAGVLVEAGFTTEELAAICENAGILGQEQLSLYMEGEPGRGGVTRGPGAAPLQYIDKTDENLGSFQAEAFQGRQGDPTIDLGTITTTPDESDVEPPIAAPGGAIRSFGPGNERLTWNARLLPRHSDVLKRYFNSR